MDRFFSVFKPKSSAKSATSPWKVVSTHFSGWLLYVHRQSTSTADVEDPWSFFWRWWIILSSYATVIVFNLHFPRCASVPLILYILMWPRYKIVKDWFGHHPMDSHLFLADVGLETSSLWIYRMGLITKLLIKLPLEEASHKLIQKWLNWT